MAPSICTDELQAVGEAPGQLQVPTVIARVASRNDTDDRIGKSDRSVFRSDIRNGAEISDSQREPGQRGRARRREESRDVLRGGYIGDFVVFVLDRQVHAFGAEISRLESVILSENVLDAEIVVNRIRQDRIGDERGRERSRLWNCETGIQRTSVVGSDAAIGEKVITWLTRQSNCGAQLR